MERTKIIIFLVGLIVITLVFMIPYLGFVFRLIVFFFGTGMFVLLCHSLWKDSLKKTEA